MVKLRGVPKLRALILTNNAITGIRGVPPSHDSMAAICCSQSLRPETRARSAAGLDKLPDLNTLVIKNNSITELSDMLRCGRSS
jgi:hypothetical protein